MGAPTTKVREPSRRVVERGETYRHHTDVRLSCGHALIVRAYSRYSSAATLGCLKCRDGKPVGPEDVL